jgi:transcriptional regulator with XRE-family HTH domain
MQLQIPAVQEESAPSKEHARVLHQLLGEIEVVRLKRQEDYREKGHPQLKRFTQQELNDEACPTYKNWLIGRSNRLPSRSTLMNIADYLECSLSQGNDLLLAAQYLPEQPEWEGDELRQALENAQQIMETLPYPAIVVTHTFQIHAANEFFLRLLELPPLDTIPQHQRSTIHFLFHPDFRIRARSTINAEARATWQKHALYGIQLFKQNNVLYQYDAWYQQFVKQCCSIADFQEYWEKARETTRQENAPPKIFLARMATTGELLPIRVQHMLVSVSSKIYPAVSALLPVDEAARAVYASFGSGTSWPSSVG